MIRKTKIFWRFILLTLINSLLSVILQHFFCKISFSIVKRNSTMSTLYISLTCIMRCWYPKQFKGKHCLSQPLYLLILIRYYSQHLYILSISTNLTWERESPSPGPLLSFFCDTELGHQANSRGLGVLRGN